MSAFNFTCEQAERGPMKGCGEMEDEGRKKKVGFTARGKVVRMSEEKKRRSLDIILFSGSSPSGDNVIFTKTPLVCV